MGLFEILSLLGGLAIFLFGMQVMGDGLERRGGGKLKSILESMTSSPIKGVLLGAGVTAIIQSSSATTVMVVGFVNSGIMKLGQAIGVIMGANIGTTVTAWLLSLIGIESGNIFVQLLKPSSFSPILAVIGIVFMMFLKSPKKKDTGSILVGFAVLMTGMDMMSASVAGLKENEAFAQLLVLFNNPLFGVLAGAVLTAIIQSSSASVGILQALSTTGRITYSNAVPIIMGQNIGTCITAILSAIGANKNAKRVSVVHLSFNIIGTICFMVLFYLLDWLIGFAFIDNSINAAGIAVVHTTFNVFATIIMFPFTKALEKLSMMIIRDDNTDDTQSVLDERLLSTPSVAIIQAKKVTNDMGYIAKDSLIRALNLIGNFDEKAARKIREDESKADKYEDILGTYLVKLSRESLNEEDSHEVSNLLHCIGDFERISDHAVNIVESAEELHDKKIVFSADAVHELQVMTSAITEILENTYSAFKDEDLDIAKKVEPLEQIVDKLKAKMRANHIVRLQNDECTIETGFIYSDLITSFERVADHCSNIGVCLLSVANDSFDTHEYLQHVKADGENNFKENYALYKEKYSI
ncbi:MAG: Na/Pi cotransporter family protein [Clostridia bacterium]|nr:Na/Pi cotransporter family protein [Clostridia bacterium]